MPSAARERKSPADEVVQRGVHETPPLVERSMLFFAALIRISSPPFEMICGIACFFVCKETQSAAANQVHFDSFRIGSQMTE